VSTWRKIQAAFDVNPRVTRMGKLFVLTCILVAMAAFSSANNLLFLILAAMLSTLMISGFISRLSLAGLALDFLLPEHICAKRKITGRIVIQNQKRWMSTFSLHLAGYGQNSISVPLYFPLIPGGALVEQPVELYFDRRGSFRENSFRFSTQFPFGFVERHINVFVRREVLVYPSVDPRPGFDSLLIALSGEIESLYRGQGSDFYRIRPYEALETARHVDWKATAHTGDLQVREFAREQELSVDFFLDLDVGEQQSDWFENAVDCCAFLTWNMAEAQRRVRFRTQMADIQVPGDGDIYNLLKYLATVAPVRGKALPPLNDRHTFQIVFSPAPEKLQEAGWDLSARNVRLLGADRHAEVESQAAV
jgi:uncharacterized protein (DUF58 family)